MSLLEDLADLLVLAGAGVQGTSLFVGRMPSEVAECVSVQTYQGMTPRYVHNTANPIYERPSFQVLVRGASLAAVEAKAQTIWAYLAAITMTTVNSTRFLAIRPYHSPFELPQDGNDRYLYAFSAEAMIQR